MREGRLDVGPHCVRQPGAMWLNILQGNILDWMQEWHRTDEMYGMCNGVGLTQYDPLLWPGAGVPDAVWLQPDSPLTYMRT